MYPTIFSCLVSKFTFAVANSAAKPDPFFRVEPNFGPKIRVELGRVGPQGQKTGPIGSDWPQIGFKFGFPIWTWFWFGLGPQVQIRLSCVRLGPQGPNLGRVGWVHLAALISTKHSSASESAELCFYLLEVTRRYDCKAQYFYSMKSLVRGVLTLKCYVFEHIVFKTQYLRHLLWDLLQGFEWLELLEVRRWFDEKNLKVLDFS